jgi:hypothetical protein
MANLVQIIRKARLGCDAILPGGQTSSLWQDDELVDLADEATEELELRLRLKMKKWGVQTLTSTSPAFTREGETYTPSANLVVPSGSTSLLLPPDLGEIVRILCTSDTTARFVPASFESQYWIEMTQGSLNQDGTFTAGADTTGQTYYYDIIAERTLAITPPTPVGLSLSLDYTPMKQPLFYSNAGTVSIVQGQTVINGTGTTWLTDGIFAAGDKQRAELISGVSTLGDNTVRLDRNFPAVASITSNTLATLQLPWAPATLTNSSFILAMVPTLPRVYHRWIARLTAVLMLSKINPDLSDRYAKQVMERFVSSIAPTANRRQIQESPVTDAESLMGGIAAF